MSEKWECKHCDFSTDIMSELWQHIDAQHADAIRAKNRRFYKMNRDEQYQSIMDRRNKQIQEIKQYKIDAESWNQNIRKPDEEPIDTSWCDELLQKTIEMIPRKPK